MTTPPPLTLSDTLKSRGTTYGSFKDNAAVAQALKRVMHASPNWAFLTDDQREGLDLVALKVSRILTGDPTYADNYHDGAGYFKLMEDGLKDV